MPLGITLTDRQPWRVSIPAGITLTDRQSHSEGWVCYQGLHLLTDSLTVKDEYLTRDYTYWQTVSQWRVSMPPGIHLLTDSLTVKGEYPSRDYTYLQSHSEGWVCHQKLHLLRDSLTVNGEYPTLDYTYWQTVSKWRMSMLPGITLTDRQSHSEGWVCHQELHLLTDSLTVNGKYPTRNYTYWQTVSQWRVSIPAGITLTYRQSHSEGWVCHQELHLLTDSLTVNGEYPTRNYTYWQTVSQWRVSIPAGITLTYRQSHSEGWVCHQKLHLLRDSLTVNGEYPTLDYTYWQTVSRWRMSISPGITLTDRQSQGEGWVSHNGLHLLTDSPEGWVSQ